MTTLIESSYEFKFLAPSTEGNVDAIDADKLGEMLAAVEGLKTEPTLEVHVKGAQEALKELQEGKDFFEDLSPEHILHVFAFRCQYEAHCDAAAKVIAQLNGEG